MSSVSDEDLDKAVDFPWAEQVVERYGSVGPATLGETVLQVVLRSTHHRGQLAARIRELGGEPPVTDFVAWLWMTRPTPQWRGDTARLT